MSRNALVRKEFFIMATITKWTIFFSLLNHFISCKLIMQLEHKGLLGMEKKKTSLTIKNHWSRRLKWSKEYLTGNAGKWEKVIFFLCKIQWHIMVYIWIKSDDRSKLVKADRNLNSKNYEFISVQSSASLWRRKNFFSAWRCSLPRITCNKRGFFWMKMLNFWNTGQHSLNLNITEPI